MKEINSNNFGVLIAYLVPGFIVVVGCAQFSETTSGWLLMSSEKGTIGGFLYGTLAAMAAGMIVNTARWHLVDPLHYMSGVPRRNWDYSKLPENLSAFQFLVSNQFRYYECYANSFVAVAFTAAAVIGPTPYLDTRALAGFFAIEVVLWIASRRTLLLYHERVAAFLCDEQPAEQSMPKTIDQESPNRYTEAAATAVRQRRIPFLIWRKPTARMGIQSNNR